jgi:hypothetical protein
MSPMSPPVGSWVDDLKHAGERVAETVERDTKVRLAIAAVGVVGAIGLIVVLSKLADP